MLLLLLLLVLCCDCNDNVERWEPCRPLNSGGGRFNGVVEHVGLFSHSSRLVLGEGSWPTGPWLPWSCAGEKKKQGETSSYLGNVALGRIKGNLR